MAKHEFLFFAQFNKIVDFFYSSCFFFQTKLLYFFLSSEFRYFFLYNRTEKIFRYRRKGKGVKRRKKKNGKYVQKMKINTFFLFVLKFHTKNKFYSKHHSEYGISFSWGWNCLRTTEIKWILFLTLLRLNDKWRYSMQKKTFVPIQFEAKSVTKYEQNIPTNWPTTTMPYRIGLHTHTHCVYVWYAHTITNRMTNAWNFELSHHKNPSSCHTLTHTRSYGYRRFQRRHTVRVYGCKAWVCA